MDFNDAANRSFTPPWSRTQSLNEMTAEAGIDFDQFIQGIKEDKDLVDMAEQFQVDPSTIQCLQQHFFSYGIGSIIGGD